MKKPDGGPAFPVAHIPHRAGEQIERGTDGLSLRDWFAGQAMAAMCAGRGAEQVAERDERYNETNWAEIVASNAYGFADAMLSARESTK